MQNLTDEDYIKSIMDTPCKEWTKAHTPFGHGLTWLWGRLWYVHRLAWIFEHGHIPDSLCVLHRCDNPPCWELEHLFLGTRADNQQDMMQKGRSRKQDCCSKGHPMMPNSRGHYCKTCHNLIANRARDRRRNERYHGFREVR